MSVKMLRAKLTAKKWAWGASPRLTSAWRGRAALCVMLICCALSMGRTQAAELMESYTSVRALGMGNAFTAVAEEGDALFYNPGSLCQVSGFHWTMMDPYAGVNGPQALDVVNSMTQSGSSFVDKFNNLFGKSIWVGAGAKTSFVLPCMGIAAYGQGNASMSIANPAYPQIMLAYNVDYGVALGGGLPLIPGFVSLGLTARRVNRTGTNLPIGAVTLAQLNTDAIAAQLKRRGTGYALDVGLSATIPSPVKPTLAFTVRNAGLTTFNHEEGPGAPPAAEPDMAIGASLSIDSLIMTITPSIDYRYIDRTDIQNGKKLHLGLEFDLPLLTLRTGYYQGYYTAGVGLDMGVLALDAATYGVELGEYPGQLEDRRYVAQMTIQIGLDGSFLSLSGASGTAGGARRRLKQRR
jgi:hypothetical protein